VSRKIKKNIKSKKSFFWLWFSALNFPSTAAPGEAELAILQEHLDPQPTRGVPGTQMNPVEPS